MPFAWDDSVDTPQAYDAAASFVGGQFSFAKARTLQGNQAALLQDCEIQITGQVSTRFGTAQLGGSVGSSTIIDALTFMNATGSVYEVAISGGHFYKLNGGSWTSLGTFAVSDQPSMVQGASKLYLAAGGDINQWDGTTQTSLSGDGNTQAPRNASILVWHTNRLVAAGSLIKSLSTDTAAIPDAIYFSDFLDASSWTGDGAHTKNEAMIRVGAGDGLAITSVVPWTNFNLAVFKRRSTWVVTADPSAGIAQFDIQLVHGSVGCVARRTAVQVGSDILFLADDGIRSLSQVIGSDQQHELSVPLSFPVHDVIQRVNWASASGAAAVFWRNLYICALPLDGSSTNNYLLVFNTVTKSWQGIWTHLPVYSLAVRESGGVPRLMLGLSTTNKVVEYLDYVNPSNWVDVTFQDYDAVTVQPRVKTRAFLLGDALATKLGFGGEVEWNNSSGSINITPILDEVAKTAVTISIASGGFVPPITPPFFIAPNGLARAPFDLMQYGEFRELQFDMIGSGTGRKEIRQLAVSGIVRPTLVGRS